MPDRDTSFPAVFGGKPVAEGHLARVIGLDIFQPVKSDQQGFAVITENRPVMVAERFEIAARFAHVVQQGQPALAVEGRLCGGQRFAIRIVVIHNNSPLKSPVRKNAGPLSVFGATRGHCGQI